MSVAAMPRCVATSKLPTTTRWNTARNSSSEAGRKIRRSVGAGHTGRRRPLETQPLDDLGQSGRLGPPRDARDTASATAESASCPAVGHDQHIPQASRETRVCARDKSSAASAARSGTSASTCRKSRRERTLAVLTPPTTGHARRSWSRQRRTNSIPDEAVRAATSSRSESASTNPTGSFIANPTGSSSSARVAGSYQQDCFPSRRFIDDRFRNRDRPCRQR